MHLLHPCRWRPFAAALLAVVSLSSPSLQASPAGDRLDGAMSQLQGCAPLQVGFFDDVTTATAGPILYRHGTGPWAKIPIDDLSAHSIVRLADGKWLLNDTDNHRMIQLGDLSGRAEITLRSELGGFRLSRPHDQIVNPKTGDVYVIDGNRRLFRFKDLEGAVEVWTFAENELGYVRGMSWFDDHLHLASASTGTVVRIDDYDARRFTTFRSPYGPPQPPAPRSAGMLVLNDVDKSGDWYYGTSFFAAAGAVGNDTHPVKLIRWRRWADFEAGEWEDLSAYIAAGKSIADTDYVVPYFMTMHDNKLYTGLVDVSTRPQSGEKSCSHGRILQLDLATLDQRHSRQQPFYCETKRNGLGPATDSDCSAGTIVTYYYRTTEPVQLTQQELQTAAMDATMNPRPQELAPGFKPYPTSGARPTDVAKLKLSSGRSVDYVVRREVGVINRAVYEIKLLHTPGTPLPSPWTLPTSAWNGRLVYRFEGGCSAGYHQGVLLGWAARLATDQLLEQGYALATSTLNIARVTCDHEVSAETAAMVKEHFIETFGEPAWTMGVGRSGGAMMLQLMAQNHPGIVDGLLLDGSAADPLAALQRSNECALLRHVFESSQAPWSEAEKTAVTGLATWRLCLFPGSGYDPRLCADAIPKERIYHRATNPTGLRCTYFDNAPDIFGRDSVTSFANRPFDNSGVQYGLEAFNSGKIGAEQFVELNQRVGGYDADGGIVSARSTSSSDAIARAYSRDAVFSGRGLDSVPIISWSAYGDDIGDGHTRDAAFAIRARLIAANGHADNHVILVTPRRLTVLPHSDEIPGTRLTDITALMDRWLARIDGDRQEGPLSVKIVRNRSEELADGCFKASGERVAEPASLTGPSVCNQLYPVHSNPRRVAGEPLAGDVLKCTLKPIRVEEYARPLSADQIRQLRTIFPNGVCDYSLPGVRRHVPLEGTANFRDLGGYVTADGKHVRQGMLYRSDALDSLTPNDWQKLERLNIARITDFRSTKEVRRRPDHLSAALERRRVHVPLEYVPRQQEPTAGTSTLADIDRALTEFYPRFARESRAEYGAWLKSLLDGSPAAPHVFHCTGGADRTGFGAAVLLMALGVSREQVLEDYLLTNRFLYSPRGHALLGKRVAGSLPDGVQVQPSYLDAAFDAITADYGSFDAYLRDGLGIDDGMRRRLRQKYLE